MTTEAEREAQVRTDMDGPARNDRDWFVEARFFRRLLDEARGDNVRIVAECNEYMRGKDDEIARLRSHGRKESTTYAAPNALPCPFCGSHNVQNWRSDEHHVGTWLMLCFDCEAEGPETQSQEAAIAAWNARLAPPPGASAMERANAWYQYWERSTARTADNIVWLAQQIEQAEANGISRGVQRASARIEQAEREARAAAIEEAARVIEEGQETHSSSATEDRRYLSPRRRGNLAGLTYAEAIRALIVGKE